MGEAGSVVERVCGKVCFVSGVEKSRSRLIMARFGDGGRDGYMLG